LLSSVNALSCHLAMFDPAQFSGADCKAWAERFATLEKQLASARLWASTRVMDCVNDPRATAEWMARAAGTTTAQARDTLETAGLLEDCPATKAALADGELSIDEAKEIAKAQAAAPGCEAELLGFAQGHGLGGLKNEARKRRLGAVDPNELHRRQQAARSFRHWRDELGMTCFAGKLPPDRGVAFVNRLDAETDRVFRAANKTSVREPRDAYAADAFMTMINEGGGKGRASSADVIFVCDLNAYRRGHAHAGEVCHIIDGGPIPVDIVREMANDAFLKVVLHDGVNIHTVSHLGRHIPAVLRTALELGEPPGFDGLACDEPGCDRKYGLQYDHIDPVANHGPTSKNNVKPRCTPHHQEKTERDRKAGLLSKKPLNPKPPP
jgi:hypothetical protein